MKAKVVYDFADEWPRLYPFIFFGVFLFCVFYFGRTLKKYRKESIAFTGLFRNREFIGSILMGLFCFFLGYMTLDIADYQYAKEHYRMRNYKQSFGYVTNFTESNQPKCKTIKLMLNGLHFTFADCYSLYGCSYKPVATSGIDDSSLVRIYYVDDAGDNAVLWNRVLRLESFK